jgi:hypothetical protein
MARKERKIADKADSLPVESSKKVSDKLTSQEWTFLELYFCTPYKKGRDRMTIEKAMIQAGYANISQKERYRKAESIVKRYEQQADDSRKVFQDLHFGQVRIAQGIIDKAKNAKSEMVSLNALGLAAKATRMLQEPEQAHQGVKIIINCPVVADPNQPHQGPPGITIQDDRPTIPPPQKPLMITK